jgi:hypothetical protein
MRFRTNLALFSSVVLTTLTSVRATAQVPTNGLVSLYNFCGNTNDASGNGHNLVSPSVLGPTLTTDRFGNSSNAYSFNKVNGDYLIYNDTLTGTGSWTYSVWVYPTATQNSIIIANGNSNSNGYGLVMNNGTHTVPGDKITVIIGGIKYVPGPSVTMNNWHHAAIRRMNGVISLFVDGTKYDSTTTIPYPPGSPNQFTVGREGAGGPNPFAGKIDEVAVYNRALSNAEITQLYNSSCNVMAGNVPASKTAATGSTTQFSVGASNSGFTYQWQRYTGTSWVNLANTPPYSGVTTPTLTITNVSSALNNAQFQCWVTNMFCCTSGSSESASLTVTASDIPESVYGPGSSANEISIVQNSAGDFILSWSTTSPQQWTLLDLSGRKLTQGLIERQAPSALISSPEVPGVYVLDIMSRDGSHRTQKLVVNR